MVVDIVIGFILVNALNMVEIGHPVALIVLSAIVAYAFSRAYYSSWFNNLLRVVGIKKTVNTHLWNDIEDTDNSMWVRVILNELNVEYCGLLAQIEDLEREPLIVLSRFYCRALNGKDDIVNYQNDPTRRVLIDTSKASVIEFQYNKNSKVIARDKAIVPGNIVQKEAEAIY